MNYTTDLQVGDAVEYIAEPEQSPSQGTVLAVDFGSGWSEPKIRVQWRDIEPTWVRASTLRQIC